MDRQRVVPGSASPSSVSAMSIREAVHLMGTGIGDEHEGAFDIQFFEPNSFGKKLSHPTQRFPISTFPMRAAKEAVLCRSKYDTLENVLRYSAGMIGLQDTLFREKKGTDKLTPRKELYEFPVYAAERISEAEEIVKKINEASRKVGSADFGLEGHKLGTKLTVPKYIEWSSTQICGLRKERYNLENELKQLKGVAKETPTVNQAGPSHSSEAQALKEKLRKAEDAIKNLQQDYAKIKSAADKYKHRTVYLEAQLNPPPQPIQITIPSHGLRPNVQPNSSATQFCHSTPQSNPMSQNATTQPAAAPQLTTVQHLPHSSNALSGGNIPSGGRLEQEGQMKSYRSAVQALEKKGKTVELARRCLAVEQRNQKRNEKQLKRMRRKATNRVKSTTIGLKLQREKLKYDTDRLSYEVSAKVASLRSEEFGLRLQVHDLNQQAHTMNQQAHTLTQQMGDLQIQNRNLELRATIDQSEINKLKGETNALEVRAITQRNTQSVLEAKISITEQSLAREQAVVYSLQKTLAVMENNRDDALLENALQGALKFATNAGINVPIPCNRFKSIELLGQAIAAHSQQLAIAREENINLSKRVEEHKDIMSSNMTEMEELKNTLAEAKHENSSALSCVKKAALELRLVKPDNVKYISVWRFVQILKKHGITRLTALDKLRKEKKELVASLEASTIKLSSIEIELKDLNEVKQRVKALDNENDVLKKWVNTAAAMLSAFPNLPQQETALPVEDELDVETLFDGKNIPLNFTGPESSTSGAKNNTRKCGMSKTDALKHQFHKVNLPRLSGSSVQLETSYRPTQLRPLPDRDPQRRRAVIRNMMNAPDMPLPTMSYQSVAQRGRNLAGNRLAVAAPPSSPESNSEDTTEGSSDPTKGGDTVSASTSTLWNHITTSISLPQLLLFVSGIALGLGIACCMAGNRSE